jgi:hypothetical protein
MKPLTVSEIIDKLRELPQETEVYVAHQTDVNTPYDARIVDIFLGMDADKGRIIMRTVPALQLRLVGGERGRDLVSPTVPDLNTDVVGIMRKNVFHPLFIQ